MVIQSIYNLIEYFHIFLSILLMNSILLIQFLNHNTFQHQNEIKRESVFPIPFSSLFSFSPADFSFFPPLSTYHLSLNIPLEPFLMLPFLLYSSFLSLGARNLRKDVLGTFSTSYKLKTMATGALVREWPKGYSVWNEDASAPDGSGYRLLQTYKNDPTREIMNELYDVRTLIVCYVFRCHFLYLLRLVLIRIHSFIIHTSHINFFSLVFHSRVIFRYLLDAIRLTV